MTVKYNFKIHFVFIYFLFSSQLLSTDKDFRCSLLEVVERIFFMAIRHASL